MAYHHAAGVYVGDEKMKKLGTAAVHLLTMATNTSAPRRNSGAPATAVADTNPAVRLVDGSSGLLSETVRPQSEKDGAVD
jgi:hypothetical protein